MLKRAVKASFEQRRKTLRNALAPVAGSTAAAERVLAAAAIDSTARPETIDVDGWFSIATGLSSELEMTRE